jgi:C-terminal processing protease CtpA/Prc
LIEGQGLTPDIVLEPLAEDEDEDLYLDRAIEILKEELNANSQAKNRW